MDEQAQRYASELTGVIVRARESLEQGGVALDALAKPIVEAILARMAAEVIDFQTRVVAERMTGVMDPSQSPGSGIVAGYVKVTIPPGGTHGLIENTGDHDITLRLPPDPEAA